jgi:hypothetical protein
MDTRILLFIAMLWKSDWSSRETASWFTRCGHHVRCEHWNEPGWLVPGTRQAVSCIATINGLEILRGSVDHQSSSETIPYG